MKPNSCFNCRLTGTIVAVSIPSGSLKCSPGGTSLRYFPKRCTTATESLRYRVVGGPQAQDDQDDCGEDEYPTRTTAGHHLPESRHPLPDQLSEIRRGRGSPRTTAAPTVARWHGSILCRARARPPLSSPSSSSHHPRWSNARDADTRTHSRCRSSRSAASGGTAWQGLPGSIPHSELFGPWDNREGHASNEPRKTGQAASRSRQRTPFALQLTTPVKRLAPSSLCFRCDSRSQRVHPSTVLEPIGHRPPSKAEAARHRQRELTALARDASETVSGIPGASGYWLRIAWLPMMMK